MASGFQFVGGYYFCNYFCYIYVNYVSFQEFIVFCVEDDFYEVFFCISCIGFFGSGEWKFVYFYFVIGIFSCLFGVVY